VNRHLASDANSQLVRNVVASGKTGFERRALIAAVRSYPRGAGFADIAAIQRLKIAS
jgi:hypothetical protein